MVLFPLQHFAVVTQASCWLTSDPVVPAPGSPTCCSSKRKHGSGCCGQGHGSNLSLFAGCSLFLSMRNTLKLALQRNSLHYVKSTVNGNNRSHSNVHTLCSRQQISSYNRMFGGSALRWKLCGLKLFFLLKA